MNAVVLSEDYSVVWCAPHMTMAVLHNYGSKQALVSKESQ